jgi:hypothetical protein
MRGGVNLAFRRNRSRTRQPFRTGFVLQMFNLTRLLKMEMMFLLRQDQERVDPVREQSFVRIQAQLLMRHGKFS